MNQIEQSASSRQPPAEENQRFGGFFLAISGSPLGKESNGGKQCQDKALS
jgi:hypothetical protein